MSKIVRKTMKVFGLSAGLNQIAQFGSLAAAAPVYSTDPTVIQALSNYLGGWVNALLGDGNPAVEDMNALFYLYAYQLASIFQDGIAEWDSGTTYYTGSLVLGSDNLVYQSFTDTNLGNNPTTDPTNWGQQTQNGLVTANAAPSIDKTVLTGTTLTWPNLTIPTSKTWTVQTNANLLSFGAMTVNGTLTVNGTSTVL